MRLLLVSDGAQTGFGRVGRELAIRWHNAGADLRWVVINYRGRDGEVYGFMQSNPPPEALAAFVADLDADPLRLRKIPAVMGGDPMGHVTAAQVIAGSYFGDGWRPERVVIVADPRAMGERLKRTRRAMTSVPTFNYVPIEGANLPPAWGQLWENIVPVAMSTFGQNELQRLLGKEVPLIPHGISEAFRPLSSVDPGNFVGQAVRSKDEAKAVFGYDGRTVILRTDRLVPRKNYPALFRSLAPVLAEDPSRLLVIHCAPLDEGGDMAEMISHLPGAFEVDHRWRHPQIRFTGGHDTFRGWSDDALRVLYGSADLYASPTKAEGFGLTLAEAAACGVPVITTDYAAGPETVGPGAVLVPPIAMQTHEAIDWALVDERTFSSETSLLLSDPIRRTAIGQAGTEYVKRFSWDRAATDFLTLMG